MTEALEVPLLDLPAQFRSMRGEVEAAVARVLDQQSFVLGPEVRAFEREVAAFCGAAHSVGCASGSDALLLSLMALDVGPGDQVLCPTYSFFATAGSIARAGAEPVFFDLDPVTGGADLASLTRAAAGCRRLRAIVPVHLFGRAAGRRAVFDLAHRLGVPVVEDAAQALGAVDDEGVRVGNGPGTSCFSFFPSKNLGAYGDGGLVATNDPILCERLRALRAHGAPVKDQHVRVGLNSRLDALQAAVLRAKLPHLEWWNHARLSNARHYEDLFRKAGAQGVDVPLADGGLPLRIPVIPPEPAVHTFHQYAVRVPVTQRDELRESLASRGVETAVYYPTPLHLQPCFQGLGYREGDFPEAERAARESVALPIFPELTEVQREHVAECVVSFLRRAP